MATDLKTGIFEALRDVRLPGSRHSIDVSGRAAGLAIKETPEGAHISFSLEVDPSEGPTSEPLRHAAEKMVTQMEGVASVSVVLTAHRSAPPQREPKIREKLSLPHLKRIIAVASGKGGVGKSTTAVNLAVAFAKKGLKTGLLDADIYGPSVPRMLKLSERPEVGDDKKLIPPVRDGLAVMSMGLLIPEETPMIWRGPMVHTAIQQLFRDVAWGERDIVIVDLPPGTGDAQMTMAQLIPLTGSVIVSTPQDIALIDARKGLAMFQKMEVPVLGIVENMSTFVCPHCGNESDIFGHGGARLEAERLNVPFLGEIPLERALRYASDMGDPLVLTDPKSPIAEAYTGIAEKLWASVEKLA